MSNFIEVIPERIFQNCAQLVLLDLNLNRIRAIADDAFVGLSSLRTLWLQTNSIPRISRNLLRNIPSIRSLLLSQNEIEEIPVDAFVDLAQLNGLVLNRNRIATWSGEILSRNPTVNHLDLGENRIRNIPANIFSNIPNLVTLSIGGLLEEVPAFEGISSLQNLAITNSPITRVSAFSLRHLPNLNSLNFRDCRIESVDFSMTSPRILENLRQLELQNNSISNLNESSFEMLTSLVYLGLARNQIENLTLTTLEPVLPLDSFQISHNRISRMEREIFEQSPNMIVSSEGNPCFSGSFTVGTNFDLNQLNRCFNSGLSLKMNIFVLLAAAVLAFFGKL
jgi:insulin-like growth factor-binding protein complex acid labile subunit